MLKHITHTLCLLALTTFAPVGHCEIWSLGTDFSTTMNPNGVWAYGWRLTAADPLVLYVDTAEPCGPDVDFWLYDIADNCPCVYHNALPDSNACAQVLLAPHAVAFHAGMNDEQSVVRWRAPVDGSIDVDAAFQTLDVGGTTVHIYHNGVELFTQSMNGSGGSCQYSSSAFCHMNDTIDFAVNWGPSGHYWGSSTGISVLISSGVPTATSGSSWGAIKATFRTTAVGGLR